MRKKISHVILTLCILLAFTLPCFANFQPRSDRWAWCGSSNTMGVWVDKDSIYERQIPGGDTMVYLWTLFYHNSPTEYIEKIQFTVDLRERNLGVQQYIRLDMNGNVTETISPTNSPRDEIVPGSYSEGFYKIAKAYHEAYNRNDDI